MLKINKYVFEVCVYHPVLLQVLFVSFVYGSRTRTIVKNGVEQLVIHCPLLIPKKIPGAKFVDFTENGSKQSPGIGHADIRPEFIKINRKAEVCFLINLLRNMSSI